MACEVHVIETKGLFPPIGNPYNSASVLGN